MCALKFFVLGVLIVSFLFPLIQHAETLLQIHNSVYDLNMMYSMNYSHIRTANPLALGLEMSSLAVFSTSQSFSSGFSSFITLSELYKLLGPLINNTDLCWQEVQAGVGVRDGGGSGRCWGSGFG